jgi:hypothetical protein
MKVIGKKHLLTKEYIDTDMLGHGKEARRCSLSKEYRERQV